MLSQSSHLKTLHTHHHINHIQASENALPAESVNQAMIHLKHRGCQIISLITACQMERITLIRLLPLVSTVIENHLQFAPDIEIAKDKSLCSVWCDNHFDLSSRQDGGSRAWWEKSAESVSGKSTNGLDNRAIFENRMWLGVYVCGVHGMHKTRSTPTA